MGGPDLTAFLPNFRRVSIPSGAVQLTCSTFRATFRARRTTCGLRTGRMSESAPARTSDGTGVRPARTPLPRVSGPRASRTRPVPRQLPPPHPPPPPHDEPPPQELPPPQEDELPQEWPWCPDEPEEPDEHELPTDEFPPPAHQLLSLPRRGPRTPLFFTEVRRGLLLPARAVPITMAMTIATKTTMMTACITGPPFDPPNPSESP